MHGYIFLLRTDTNVHRQGTGHETTSGSFHQQELYIFIMPKRQALIR